MTIQAQEKTVERTEMEAKAKALGIKGVHLYGDEKLMGEINRIEAEGAKVEAPKRKKAPKMKVSSVVEDSAEKLIRRLEREDPDCKYLLQPIGTTALTLAEKQLEATGETIGDCIVCRTDKEGYQEYVNSKNAATQRMMQSIDPSGERIKGHVASAKIPKPEPKES